MENPLYKTEKLIGHHFRQVIKTGFVERQPYRNKCQHREKALTAASGLFWAGTGQIKKSNSDLMWHPALFQYPERSSSFLEAASSSSAPEGRGEQQDRAPVSQHVSQGDARGERREERWQVTAVSARSCQQPRLSRVHGAAHPSAQQRARQGGMQVSLVRCVAEGEK